FAVGALWFFDVAEWPMVRPDIMVSFFAVAFVVAAGLAVSVKRPIWWFAAGLAAACGALTHLIAWSLVPAALLVWAVAGNGSRSLLRSVRLGTCAVARLNSCCHPQPSGPVTC